MGLERVDVYEQLKWQRNKGEFLTEPTQEAGQERFYKQRVDVIDKLIRMGKLKEDHRIAALEIERIYGALQRCFMPCARNLENEPVDGRAAYRDPADRLSEVESYIYSERYKPWAEAMSKIPIRENNKITLLTLSIDMIVDNIGPRQWEVVNKYPLGRTATSCLSKSLECYLGET